MAKIIRPTPEQWQVLEDLGLVYDGIMADLILVHPDVPPPNGRKRWPTMRSLYLDDAGGSDVRMNVVYDEWHPQMSEF